MMGSSVKFVLLPFSQRKKGLIEFAILAFGGDCTGINAGDG